MLIISISSHTILKVPADAKKEKKAVATCLEVMEAATELNSWLEVATET